ncbi:alpha-L-fucosidase [Microbacterium sp. CFBP 13617]|uniref:alpha-L-fucosidase n=1 Tax=Microbacterium sp. CFBP 13617 TaxID=2774035 RepID=UPI00313FE04B
MTAPLSPRVRTAAGVFPSARQLAWQRREFTAFLHVGMNTVTDREWGLGHEDPALFDPSGVDTDQWMRSIAASGARGVILTAKHHDGFCLWPSALTAHSVATSPWRDGRGDLVRESAEAAARHGLAFGIYLSPWDRTDARYGSGTPYDDFFVGQLTELLTGYGPISTVWLDGANGEGPDGRVQTYDWDRYYEVVRRLQPDAVLSVCGPDVRWCGNEAGHTRADEWSVVPASLRDAERVASRSQQQDDAAFARLVRSDEDDLGSRAALEATDDDLVWYPAEVNTSIRPGWFHHPAEDEQVRSATELFDIYRRSVGGNSGFLLNVPPDASGLISAPDVEALRGLGALVAELADRDRAARATVTVAGRRVDLPTPDATLDLREGDTVSVRWDEPVEIDGVILDEDIARGQLIDRLQVDLEDVDGTTRTVLTIGAVGYRRIAELPLRRVRAAHIRLVTARGPMHLSRLSFLAPSRLLAGAGAARLA